MNHRKKLGLAAAVFVALTALAPVAASAAPAAPAPADGLPGLDGTIVSVQTDDQGAVMTVDDSGDWTLQIPASPETKPGQVGTQAFEAGLCQGTFATIAENVEGMEWGAQSACVGSSTTSWAPHSLRVELRSTCSGFPCGIFSVERTATAGGSEFDAVKTVAPTTACVTQTTYEYDQIAYPTVRGVAYGPFVDPDVAVLSCNINAD